MANELLKDIKNDYNRFANGGLAAFDKLYALRDTGLVTGTPSVSHCISPFLAVAITPNVHGPSFGNTP